MKPTDVPMNHPSRVAEKVADQRRTLEPARGASTQTPPRSALRHTVIDPRQGGYVAKLRELKEFGELLYFLVWRDVKVRYKQTVLGVAWAILQPLIAVLIFSVIFGSFLNVPSEGVPYSVFAFTGLLPWFFFSQAIGRGGVSLVGSAMLVSKMYFPRLLIPLASIGQPLVDLVFGFLVLIGLMSWYGIAPTAGIVALPGFVLLAMATALAVGLWLAALNVRYRDVGLLIPFLIQMWFYASPVVYPVTVVPEKWRLVYGLNPMTGVIQGFRWALLGAANPDFRLIGVSAAVVSLLLISSFVYFIRNDQTFADVI